MSGTLTDFLLARIAEDEASARAALKYDGAEWETAEEGDVFRSNNGIRVATGPWGDLDDTGRHIARWDPARVLAECAAKRAIVELHAVVRGEKMVYDAAAGEYLDARVPYYVCDICIDLDYEDDRGAVAPLDYPCPTIRALAAVYADHPEFREEWR